jgi:hypothetical protein
MSLHNRIAYIQIADSSSPRWDKEALSFTSCTGATYHLLYFTYPSPPITGCTSLTLPHQKQTVLYLPFSTNNNLYFTYPFPPITGCNLLTFPHQQQYVLYLPFSTNIRLYFTDLSPPTTICTLLTLFHQYQAILY